MTIGRSVLRTALTLGCAFAALAWAAAAGCASASPANRLDATARGAVPEPIEPNRSPAALSPDVYARIIVVGSDNADFPTIAAAVASAPDARPGRPVAIFLRPGTYREQVELKNGIHLIGAGHDTVRIVKDVAGGTALYDSAVVRAPNDATVRIAQLAIENPGPAYPSLAAYVSAGSLIEDCILRGHQDTVVLIGSDMRRCLIQGTSDIVNLYNHAVVEDCRIEGSGPEEAFWIGNGGRFIIRGNEVIHPAGLIRLGADDAWIQAHGNRISGGGEATPVDFNGHSPFLSLSSR